MEDLEFNGEKFQTIRTLFSEIAEIRNQLIEKQKIKTELQSESSQRERIEEESRAVKASLEEQLANSNAEKELLAEKLKQEVNERNRIEEELRVLKVSLEEQLAKLASKAEPTANKSQNERRTSAQWNAYLRLDQL